MKNSPGPVFSVRMPAIAAPSGPENALVLENMQDPGNVGTLIRTANALGIDAVILAGGCADRTSPRAVRASMGAAFRQYVREVQRGRPAGRYARAGPDAVRRRAERLGARSAHCGFHPRRRGHRQ